MKKSYLVGLAVLLAAAFSSCKKSTSESTNISTPQFSAGKTITSDTLQGSVKGTLASGKTYYFKGQVTINAGDTLVLQSGVKLLAIDTTDLFIVNGTFLSLGTQSQPNYISGVNGPSTVKHNTPIDPSLDPAFHAQWGGIQCGTTCPLLDIKWTRMDYVGGNNSTSPLPGYAAGDALFGILFQNPNGYFILEDSWFYGTTTDALRVLGGKISFMRNTVEKMAFNDGDAFNIKNGTVGDMAYNFMIGTAKGGQKISNKGTYGQESNIVMWNNTFVNGGYRSIDPARGASINYEQGCEGIAVNNLLVNCRYGVRIVGNPIADTAHIYTGYNFNYGDSVSVTNQFYPVGYLTKPSPFDIPTPSTYLPAGYTLGQAYDGTSVVTSNNPKFVNFPLPQSYTPLRVVNYATGYDFHLASGSPAIGKGTLNVTPLNATAPITNAALKATVTPPSKDMGCYPTDGTVGNQH